MRTTYSAEPKVRALRYTCPTIYQNRLAKGGQRDAKKFLEFSVATDQGKKHKLKVQ